MLIEVLEALNLDPNVIRILREKHMDGIEKIQETILTELPTLSGAMKKIGEDISRLAEILYAAAGELGQGEQEVHKIDNLSQRLICGVTEIGMILSQVGLWQINKDYLECRLQTDVRIRKTVSFRCAESLKEIVPRKLAEWIHQRLELQPAAVAARYQELPLLLKEGSPGEYRSLVQETSHETRADEGLRNLERITVDANLLARFRKQLAGVKTLHEFIPDPPEMVIDERQRLLFFRGTPVALPGKAFDLLVLLARQPLEIVTRDQIYERLWPDFQGGKATVRPYERQITDHKHRILARIREAVSKRADFCSRQLQNLILSRFGVGYLLNLPKEEVCLLPIRTGR
jgi:NADH:ubiquinone oxidoreductase subunit